MSQVERPPDPIKPDNQTAPQDHSQIKEVKPTRTISQLAKNAAGQASRTALIFWTVGAPFGLAGFLGWKLREFQLPNPKPVNITSKPLEVDVTKLTPSEKENLPKAINIYYITRQADEIFFQLQLLHNPSEVTVTLGQQAAHDHLQRAVVLLQLSQGYKKAKFVDNDGKILLIDNHEFNLANQYQFHLATAIIDRSLKDLPPPARIQPEQSTEQLSEEINLLFWLKDQNFDIQFESDSFIFFSPDKMVTLARALFLTRHDVPKPIVIQFYRTGDSRYPDPGKQSGVYDCRYSQNLPPGSMIEISKAVFLKGRNCPILISNLMDTTGIIHEIGHHAGFNSKSFGHEDFKSRVKRIEQQVANQIQYKADLYLSDHAADNNKEDYAVTFAWYIARGQEFRQLIRQMRWWDPAASQVLQTKYNFFQEKFNHQQTSENGTLLKSTNERDTLIEDMSQVKTGELFKIRDMSPSPFRDQGIHLRRDPADLASTDDSLVVFNGDRVEIIGGPEVFDQWNFVWWEVRAESRGKIQGWLASEWLGY